MLKVKDILKLETFDSTFAVSENEGESFHSFKRLDNKIMNSVVNKLDVKNGIVIMYIDKVDKAIKCKWCNNENVIKGCKCNNCGEVV